MLQKTTVSTGTAAYIFVGNGTISPTEVSPELDQISLSIPKNKSTGDLLAQEQDAKGSADGKRERASFDASTTKELSNLKRSEVSTATLQLLRIVLTTFAQERKTRSS